MPASPKGSGEQGALRQIEEQKEVFYIMANTDLTEGRGYLVTIGVAEHKETAIRFAKGKGVMGAPAEVCPGSAFKINGSWYVSMPWLAESKEDKAIRESREQKEAAIARAKAAGLSDEDIALLAKGAS